MDFLTLQAASGPEPCLGSSGAPTLPQESGEGTIGNIVDSGTKLPENDSHLCYFTAGCDLRQVSSHFCALVSAAKMEMIIVHNSRSCLGMV